jgi:Lon protease-like protein
MIGMVAAQPAEGDDMAGDPAIFDVGCAGFITDQEELPDGRYNIVLRGTQSFRVIREIPTDGERLYRLAEVSFLEEPTAEPRPSLRAAVLRRLEDIRERSGASKGFSLEQLGALDDTAFANVLCQAIGFAPEEKQGLLEAGATGARLDQLEALLAFHLAAMQGTAPGDSGTVH